MESGLITLHGPSKKYKLTKATLHDHSKGKPGLKSETYGRA